MYPNSELENYKLQVELLQEKLQRSEQNRHSLQHQLEHIVQKRHDIDKAARSKTRQKYQEFLDEQQKRNERNRMLLQMLERVDQQTATLSARSERLKMMKLQYEMYFAKLVQSQTLRCLQGSAAATAASGAGRPQMPILVATPVSASSGQQEPPSAPNAAVNQYEQQLLPAATYSPPPRFHAPHTAATAAAPTAAPRTWTLAMATPMSAGMLLAQPQAQAQTVDYIASAATPYDYLPLPLGYAMPRLQRQHLPPDGFLAPLQRIATTLEADMPTLRAFERGVTDVCTPPAELNAKLTPADAAEDKKHIVELIPRGGDSDNQQLQPRRQELLSSMSASSASSAPVPSSSSASRLTFDKLPKTLMAMTEHNFRSTDSAKYADDDDDKSAASMTTPAGAGGKTPQDWASLHINEARGPSPTTTNDRRNYAYAAGDGEDAFSFGDGGNGAAHSDFRQKINEPWQQLSTATVQPFMGATHTNPRMTEKFAPSACGGPPPPPPSQKPKDGGGDEQQQQLSIENIENAIYGELVNAPLLPASALPPDIRNTTLGLLEDAVAHSPPRAEEEERPGAIVTEAPPANADAYPQNEVLDYANYEGEGGGSIATTAADTISSSSFIQDEPTYATIDGNIGAAITTSNAEIYAEQPSEASESYEGVAGNVADYQQYAADGSDSNAQQPQQQEEDYSYANYDATQYDPNAYPGYTYDAATGEYTPDPTQQYVGEADGGGYALQPEYSEQQRTSPTYDAAGQQEVNYDYANYAQDTPNDGGAVAAYPESVEPEAQPASSEIPAFNVELTPAEDALAPATATATTTIPSAVDEAAGSKVIKPTSILATAAEKQQAAAAADGQRKKKRVNFVDSSDTDESAAAAARAAVSVAGPGAGIGAAGASSESDFEFSTSGEGDAQIEPK